ncbi:hypothetical protein A6A19_00900 [Actinobacillus delphinicola]|uniref:phage baseplate assembly protein V n=1 Tax=Actinobacillus delphinicola TaxID=51161 RepID=UPI0024429421|nr:phage baseplate assembly protein V [Actinobacillus delphinicola]MDG6896587.1 hypothetical protein [Actinobacillus delphinicola]
MKNLASDAQRRIENIVRYGTIEEIDFNTARARVRTGEIITDWLPWTVNRAGTTTIWSPPTKGEQVVVLSPSGELQLGVIILGLYTTNAPSPSQDAQAHVIKFADGATITYNQQTHALSFTGIKTAVIEASEKITFKTPLVECSDDLNIGKTSTAGVDHISNGISGHNHTHTQNPGDHHGGGVTTSPPK